VRLGLEKIQKGQIVSALLFRALRYQTCDNTAKIIWRSLGDVVEAEVCTAQLSEPEEGFELYGIEVATRSTQQSMCSEISNTVGSDNVVLRSNDRCKIKILSFVR